MLAQTVTQSRRESVLGNAVGLMVLERVVFLLSSELGVVRLDETFPRSFLGSVLKHHAMESERSLPLAGQPLC